MSDTDFVPIKLRGYSGYFINRKGEVLSKKQRDSGRLMTPFKRFRDRSKGFRYQVGLITNSGRFRYVPVAEILLRVFKNQKRKPNHYLRPVDGNSSNLHVDNWHYVPRKKVFAERFEIDAKIVSQIRTMCANGPHGIRTKAAKKFGLSKQHVSNLLNGRAKLPPKTKETCV